MNEKISKRYFSIKEVSIYTSLPVNTLYEWAVTRRIPSIQIGRRVFFDLADIDKLMEELKRSADTVADSTKKILGINF